MKTYWIVIYTKNSGAEYHGGSNSAALEIKAQNIITAYVRAGITATIINRIES